ncbi:MULTISPECIES: DUF2500 domain-containing protein [Vibrio]|mgnify:CR=1 FL=1|uniref:Uncharacterized protein n=1 Tax=Vibrio proteolyticus NBRC 13287 TaxID=1219065 RepID=U3BRP4_VIBPR|nr:MULTISPECIES: DUF2500 domain-containing protein [Vibrio]NAX22918.1 DUF2500 family protein [Vibrio sp. V39_P1S14PM300]GAD69183.1 hypothetical protein VPR01S_25_00280 [Vibrio proteolyticus NBRC 13287]
MPVSLFALIGLLVVLAAWVFLSFYRKHIQGQGASEHTVEVTILDKQAVDVADAQPGEDAQEFWIYVQKGRLGPKREFQVGVHYFHALNPGDKGILTYQGDTFLHFALKR